MVSIARPILADADFVNKAAARRSAEINTCIACSQACLDHVFAGKIASCLVNPRACHETVLKLAPARTPTYCRRRCRAGRFGLRYRAAECGHTVTLYEAREGIGGQFNLARRIPGKGGVLGDIALLQPTPDNQRRLVAPWAQRQCRRIDRRRLRPRRSGRRRRPTLPEIAGLDHPKAIAYPDLIEGRRTARRSRDRSIAGSIGFDVAELLTTPQTAARPSRHLKPNGESTNATQVVVGLSLPKRRTVLAKSGYCNKTGRLGLGILARTKLDPARQIEAFMSSTLCRRTL